VPKIVSETGSIAVLAMESAIHGKLHNLLLIISLIIQRGSPTTSSISSGRTGNSESRLWSRWGAMLRLFGMPKKRGACTSHNRGLLKSVKGFRHGQRSLHAIRLRSQSGWHLFGQIRAICKKYLGHTLRYRRRLLMVLDHADNIAVEETRRISRLQHANRLGTLNSQGINK
jgi:hypothetical protein